MKLTTGILAVAVMMGAAWAQNPDANHNQNNAVPVVAAQRTAQAKPTPGAPAPAVKPAPIPGANATAAAKPSSSSTPKVEAAPAKAAAKSPSASAASQPNRLEGVHVVQNADDVRIEISSREAVTPKVSKLSSPARVVVELPATVMATPQNKIAFGTAGVKGVRIGMDGKTPPTTSVVVDLEHAIDYELTPGPGNKFFLNLHTTQAVAKNAPKTSTVTAPRQQTVAAKPAATVPATSLKIAIAAAPKLASKPAVATTKIVAQEPPASIIKKVETPKAPVVEAKKWAMTGKRDPFFSPVVQQNSGSGCSTGKKCLEIGQINVRGVVKAETGFIAVVTNTLNKAYFLHENDPVFNGFVVKITGDSVVFKETMQDKLGKPFTREVVKRITTPAV
jgi:AMIN domain